jgi:hypothetical protein
MTVALRSSYYTDVITQTLERKAEYFRVVELLGVEVTGGVMRAVDFRRQWITFDIALRYRFA